MAHYKRIVLFVLALVLACAVAYFVRGALLLIYVSIVFAVVLSPPVDRIVIPVLESVVCWRRSSSTSDFR